MPYEFIKENDKLPHSWDVTSDSISLFIAKELGLTECYLIKDVDGIINKQNQILKEITVDDYKDMKKTNKLLNVQKLGESLKKSQPIDSYSLELIENYAISCIILNGKAEKHTILDYFIKLENENSIYTKINFN